ncbi:hypothetical protein AC249_AIPGENE10877 [Exaiptasia diaphana]|nr:hypothetical protein AC249_AIPGENE10877 [Exaiptasia diaphana]
MSKKSSPELWMIYSFHQLLILISILAGGRGVKIDGLNVIAYWSLNGSETGLTLHDGPPKFVDGRLPGSKAIQFISTPSYARIPGVDLRSKESFTIALWVKSYNPLKSGEQAILSDWSFPHYPWILGLNSGKLMFYIRQSNGNIQLYDTYPEHVIQKHTWFHFAVTWNNKSSVFELFKDGKQLLINRMPQGTTCMEA